MSRWEELSRRWFNLPAALLIGLVALVIALPSPWTDSGTSLPRPSGSEGDDAAENLAAIEPSPIDLGTPTPAASLAGNGAPAPQAAGSGTPAPQLAALQEAPAAAATPGSTTTDLAALGDVRPNELGGVPIIMYHAFTTNPEFLDEWTLTLDQFREQLDWFRENDFVMVGVQSMIDGRFDVPAGKKPIILTFDDASPGQFGLQQAADGGWQVDPVSAVGVLEEYRQQYPEFVGPAFFAVLTWNCFASDDDPSTCEDRLTWLVDNGYEVGNHTWDHVDMTDVTDEFFTNSIGSMKAWIDERLPQGPGNLSNVVVMPFGAYPSAELHPNQRAWLQQGVPWNGTEVELPVVMAVSGGPAIPPYSVKSDPSYTYRIASYPELLAPWQDAMVSGEAPVFVSDGDPGTVTIPADQLASVNEAWIAERGLEVRTYDAGAS